MNLGTCRLRVVFDAAKLNSRIIDNHIATARIAVAWLTDTANVDHDFLLAQFKFVANFCRRIEAAILSENSRHMRVPLKAILLDKAKQPFHFSLIIDVLGEHVLIERATRRAVNEQKIPVPMGAWQFGQKIPSLAGTFDGFVFQLLSSPEDGLFGAAAETVRIKQGAVVVVSQQHHLKVFAGVDALARIGTVSNDIAKAENFIDLLFFDVSQHRSKRFNVSMKVADDGSFGQIWLGG